MNLLLKCSSCVLLWLTFLNYQVVDAYSKGNSTSQTISAPVMKFHAYSKGNSTSQTISAPVMKFHAYSKGNSTSQTISAPVMKFPCGFRDMMPIYFDKNLEPKSNSRRTKLTSKGFTGLSGDSYISGGISTSSSNGRRTKNSRKFQRIQPKLSRPFFKRTLEDFEFSTEDVPIIFVPEVFNGFESKVNSWPWMALLWKQQGPKEIFFCSGVLINAYYVITAAHCVLEPVKMYVRLGEHNVNEDSEKIEDFEIVDFIFHPKYDVNLGYHDIALLKLKKRVKYREEIRPVCLPWGSKATQNYAGDSVTVTGWGSLEFGGEQSSNLQEAELFVFDASKCENSYSTLRDFNSTFPFGMTPENIICAGQDDGSKDACNGDSGGPLVRQNEENQAYTMIGIVSKGFGCGKEKFPGLYAPLADRATLQWIKDIAF